MHDSLNSEVQALFDAFRPLTWMIIVIGVLLLLYVLIRIRTQKKRREHRGSRYFTSRRK